ncbi:complex I NDUFA5 subunit family protein [bacterium]|nr:complex I NDUFA5 subunit family protein [bacterium]|tara:strand:+ start:3798 stop:4307 length:510 start_codon:yes stop_codon:yes gene_type:complete
MMRSSSRSLKRALSSRFATTTTISTNTTKATLFRFLRTSACVPFTNTNHANESIKKTTGLVGLPVMNDPINTYANLCDQVLEKIQFVPENAAYRTVVEEMYKHRKKVTLSGKTVSEIEETIAAGQIEELAVQARDELELIPKMREWKPWEFSHEIEIEKAENPTGIAKN